MLSGRGIPAPLNGRPASCAAADGFQPRWDSYGRLAETLTASVPVMHIDGNHEARRVCSVCLHGLHNDALPPCQKCPPTMVAVLPSCLACQAAAHARCMAMMPVITASRSMQAQPAPQVLAC